MVEATQQRFGQMRSYLALETRENFADIHDELKEVFEGGRLREFEELLDYTTRHLERWSPQFKEEPYPNDRCRPSLDKMLVDPFEQRFMPLRGRLSCAPTGCSVEVLSTAIERVGFLWGLHLKLNNLSIEHLEMLKESQKAVQVRHLNLESNMLFTAHFDGFFERFYNIETLLIGGNELDAHFFEQLEAQHIGTRLKRLDFSSNRFLTGVYCLRYRFESLESLGLNRVYELDPLALESLLASCSPYILKRLYLRNIPTTCEFFDFLVESKVLPGLEVLSLTQYTSQAGRVNPTPTQLLKLVERAKKLVTLDICPSGFESTKEFNRFLSKLFARACFKRLYVNAPKSYLEQAWLKLPQGVSLNVRRDQWEFREVL